MKKPKFVPSTLATLALGTLALGALPAAFAKSPGEVAEISGDGTRGGGQIVYVNGTERLRDLVDPSICRMKTGEDMRRENPAIDEVLNKVAALDWYFAEGLRREVSRLEFCFTTKLIRLRTNDRDSVINHPPQHIYNGAIRFLGTYDVYADRDAIGRLPMGDQTYLPIHEAMHSFIPAYAPRRIEAVMNAVATIAEVDQGKITQARQLHRALERWQVNYPWTARQLVAHRSAITFALAQLPTRRDILAQTADLNTLFEIERREVSPYLYAGHQAEVFGDAARKVSEVLDEYSEDFTLLDRLVNPGPGIPPIRAFDPVLVALSVPAAQENPQFMNRILESRAMREGLRLYAKLKDKGLGIEYSRIIGTGGFPMLGIVSADQKLGTEPYVVVPALSVRPYWGGSLLSAPAEIQGFVQFIISQLKKGATGWTTVERAVILNDEFYAAFGISALQAQLETLNPPVTREKAHVRALLPELPAGLRAILRQTVADVVDRETAIKLDQAIQWNRLGLEPKQNEQK